MDSCKPKWKIEDNFKPKFITEVWSVLDRPATYISKDEGTDGHFMFYLYTEH
jgi:hypothetical protein